MRAVALSLASTLVLGCKKVEPAPKELDDLFHWFWDLYEDGTDEQLAEGLVNLHDVVDGKDRDEVMDGSISRLDDGQIEAAGMDRDDASDAAGVFTVNVVECDLDGMQNILAYSHLDELFDVYETYGRDYTSSLDDWESGDDEFVTWDAWYTATAIGTEFRAEIVESMRKVPALDSEQSPFGAFIVLRRVMPEPADFGDSSKTMDQDYKIEVYYERDDGKVIHSHGIWREAFFGSSLDQDNESVQRLLLNGMADWDEDAGGYCAEGRP